VEPLLITPKPGMEYQLDFNEDEWFCLVVKETIDIIINDVGLHNAW